MNFSWKYIAGIIASLGILCVGLWNYAETLAPSDVLQVSFLDVGQGDAIYIRAPNGNDLVIDGGPDDSVTQALQKVLPLFDRDIDMIVATHPDKDHIAGLPAIFENYDVKVFLHTEVPSDSSYDEILAESTSNEEGLTDIFARRGQRFILDDIQGVYLDILFPDEDTSDFKETNDASIVSRLVYGNTSFLLTGDSPSSVERFLVQADNNQLASTVLKLGHHGSNTSSSEEYLQAVHPQFAVVSAGKNNSYHHPSPTVVKRVHAHNITILSTIDSGTITFETDGENIWSK